MSTSRFHLGLLMTCSAIIAAVLWTASVSQGGTEESDLAATVKQLTERIDSVEKTVGVAPNERVLKPMLPRLQETEGAVSDLRRFAVGERPTNQSSDLQRQLLESNRARDELDRRLSALEKDLQDVSAAARDLRDLRKELRDVERDLKNLEQRVRKLESAN